MANHRDMHRTMSWPFDGDTFPPELGAVVQRTVLDGQLPALVVGHAADGDWYVGDGINDPNVRGACVATHLHHVIDLDGSIGRLAVVPPGYEARRRTAEEPGTLEPFDMPE